MPSKGQTKVDLDQLHQYLWDRTDSKFTVVVNCHELGRIFGVHKDSVLDRVHELWRAGRIEQLADKLHGKRRRYRVFPPEGVTTKDPPRKRPVWG